MNTLIIAEAELIIKDDATAQLRISAVCSRKAGRLDVPYALKLRREKILMIESYFRNYFPMHNNNFISIIFRYNILESKLIQKHTNLKLHILETMFKV